MNSATSEILHVYNNNIFSDTSNDLGSLNNKKQKVNSSQRHTDNDILDYIKAGDIKTVTNMIENNKVTDYGITDSDGNTMLHLLIDYCTAFPSYKKVINSLLSSNKFKKYINMQNNNGNTALLNTVIKGHIDLSNILSTAGATNTIKNRNGFFVGEMDTNLNVGSNEFQTDNTSNDFIKKFNDSMHVSENNTTMDTLGFRDNVSQFGGYIKNEMSDQRNHNRTPLAQNMNADMNADITTDQLINIMAKNVIEDTTKSNSIVHQSGGKSKKKDKI